MIIDKDISHGALRVLLYLFTKPDNWNVYNKDIQKQLNISDKTLAKYWKELLYSKWLRRKKRPPIDKNLAGGYIYHIGSFSISEESSKKEESYDHSNNKPIQKQVTNNNDEFEKLWADYGKIGSKAQAKRKYLSKSFKYSDKEISLAISRYLPTIKDKKFQKHFTTFLNSISDYLEDYEDSNNDMYYEMADPLSVPGMEL